MLSFTVQFYGGCIPIVNGNCPNSEYVIPFWVVLYSGNRVGAIAVFVVFELENIFIWIDDFWPRNSDCLDMIDFVEL